jgi:hypothetical protein
MDLGAGGSAGVTAVRPEPTSHRARGPASRSQRGARAAGYLI